MKQKAGLPRWPGIVLLVCGAVCLCAGCGKHAVRGRVRARKAGPTVAFHPVFAHPVRRDFQTTVPWIGYVESARQAEVTALVSGRVQDVAVRDESPVSAEALLFRISGSALTAMQEAQQAELRSATARLKVARDTLTRKEAAVKAAKKALEARTQALISQLALAEQTAAAREAAFKQHLSTAEEVAVARAEVARLTADLSSVRSEKDRLPASDELADARRVVYEMESTVAAAKAKLADFEVRTRLRAPFDGIFTARKVSAGQTVRAGDVLATVVDPRHLRVAASLFPPAGAALDGAQAEVLLSDGEKLAVTVDRVVARSTPEGAVTLWLVGPALEGRFRPGAAVSGLVVLTCRRGARAVPRTALVYGPDETPFVFVKTSGGPRRVRVRTGAVQGKWIEIRDGLREDQAVVVSGAYELFYASFSQTYKVVD